MAVKREEQISKTGDKHWKDMSISLYDIDQSLQQYFTDIIHPQIEDDSGLIDVPIIYASPERWKAIKKDQSLRNDKGQIQSPLITYRRTDISRNDEMYIPKMSIENPELFHTFTKKYSQKNRYTQFSKLNNQQPVQEQYNVVIPRYIILTYDIIMWTDFLEQMNNLIELIDYHSGTYWGNDRFKFKTKIESYSDNSEISTDTVRIIKSNCTLTLNGYVLPDIYAKHLPNTKKYTTSKLVIGERVVEE